MRAADTNVLVRLIARDDAKQVVAAEEFVAKGAWVSLLVLQETMWVLERAYDLTRAQQATVLTLLLEHESLVIEAANVVQDSLADFRNSTRVGFSDCLILANTRAHGHTPLGTFDRKLAKLPDTESLA